MKCSKCGEYLKQNGCSLSCDNCSLIYPVYHSKASEKPELNKQAGELWQRVFKLEDENKELKNKLDEVNKKTSLFLRNLIDEFPEVAIWILVKNEEIIKNSVKENN